MGPGPEAETELMQDADSIDLDDDLLAAIAAAEAAVEELADDYPAQLAQDTALLRDAVARLVASQPGSEDHAAASVDAFGVLHDIKGQAGSFGFDSATQLAGPFCEALRGVGHVTPQLTQLLEQVADVLDDIVAVTAPEEIAARVDALLAAQAATPASSAV